jgi:hypothetical protein
MTGEGFTVQDDFAIFADVEMKVYAFVYGKAGDEAMLMVYVCT